MEHLSRSRTLIIYTKAYPYGVGEAFLHNEVKFLSGKFEKIFVIPMDCAHKTMVRELPPNVEVLELVRQSPSKIKMMLRVIKLACVEKKRFKHLLKLRYVFSYYRNALSYETALGKFYAIHPKALHYTYWFEDWALFLSEQKNKNSIKEFISRAHGYDLFEHRWQFGFIPFRSQELRQVNKLVFASQDACSQTADLHSGFKSKYIVSRIGTYDHGAGPLPAGDPFVLVSCSNVIPLKRVERIVETLKEISFPVRWIHFGDGPDLQKIKEQAATLPSHITCLFKGAVENGTLMEFYRSQAVDAMVLLSETEGGVPVSLQEAASFGIPLVGSNAGGIPEIVNENTGILVSEAATVAEVKKALETLRNNEHSRNPAFRQAIRLYWQQHYNALNSFELFYRILAQQAEA